MVRALLVRGLIVGALAGVAAFAFALAFGEPQIQRAIDLEPAGAALVSRGVQRTVGLLTATVVTGALLGGFFALAFAWAYGRIGPYGARATAALLAVAGFVTVTLGPFTKYPANPPGVGNPDTIDRRTILFAAMVVISLLAALAAWRVRAALLARTSPWSAGVVALGAFMVVIGVAQVILPRVDEVPAGFPADVLYDFRLAALGTSVTLWAAIGLGFGAVAERMLVPGMEAAPARPLETARR
jgi:hypothetical protein